MAKRRTSDAVKKSKGTYREDRAIPDPTTVEGEFTAQDFSFRTINSTYELLLEVAQETGVRSKQNLLVLRLLAMELHHLAKLARKVEKDGFSYEVVSTNGSLVKKSNPDGDAFIRLLGKVSKSLEELGWTPRSAASVAKVEEDAKQKFFEQLTNLMGGGELECS